MRPETLIIRAVDSGDAARVADIYNEGLEDRVATFETTPRTAADAACWIAADLPFVVAVVGGHLVGFARLSA